MPRHRSTCLLIVGDSRARNIKDQIDYRLPHLAKFGAVIPGVGLEGIYRRIIKEVETLEHTYTKIILLLIGGICSFTEKLKDKSIQYKKQDKLETAKESIQTIWDFAREKEIHIITSTIIPVDLAKVNNKKLDQSKQQAVLDKHIKEINTFILSNTAVGSVINLNKLASKTSLKRTGKRNQHRRRIVKLNKNLLCDGVHPGVHLRGLIQNQIVEHLNLVLLCMNSGYSRDQSSNYESSKEELQINSTNVEMRLL